MSGAELFGLVVSILVAVLVYIVDVRPVLQSLTRR